MDSTSIFFVVSNLGVAVAGALLTSRLIDPGIDIIGHRVSEFSRLRARASLEAEMRLVDALRSDAQKQFRFCVITLWLVLLAFAGCALCWQLAALLRVPAPATNLSDWLTVLAAVCSVVSAAVLACIGVIKLGDGLATLLHIDRYDDWAAYSSEKLSELSRS